MYFSSFCHVGNENFWQFVHTESSEIHGKPIYSSISGNSLRSYLDIVILLKINKKRYLFLYVNIYIINLIKIFSIGLFKRKKLLEKFTDFHTFKMLSVLNIDFLKLYYITKKRCTGIRYRFIFTLVHNLRSHIIIVDKIPTVLYSGNFKAFFTSNK